MTKIPVITEAKARKVLETVRAGLVKGVGHPAPGQMCVEAAVCYALGLPHSDDPQCVAPALRALKIVLNDCNWSSPAARAKGLERLALVQLGSKNRLDEKEFLRRLVEHAVRVSVPVALRAAASIHPNPAHAAALREAADCCGIGGRSADATYAAYAAAARSAADAAARAAARSAADAAARAAAYAAYAAADAAARAAAYAAYAAARAAADAAAYAADAAARAAAYAAVARSAADAARDKVLSDYGEAVVQILVGMKAPGAKWLRLTKET